MYDTLLQSIRDYYDTEGFIPLHAPVFGQNEKTYLNDCIDTTFVSSVGEYVDRFEQTVAEYTVSKYAIATVNGTSALHIALLLSGVTPKSEVITQSLTFVATCNAIRYCNANPVFIDIDRDTLGMSPTSLQRFLDTHCELKNNRCYNKTTKNYVSAVVPMHTFGHPCRIKEIATICHSYNLNLVEDAAEALGSTYEKKYIGTFGTLGVLSFNGNKTITTGGGGMILTNDPILAKKAKHLTSTAKVPHAYEYIHDEVGYNYRMPNINAALGVAQMENIDIILEKKRDLARYYQDVATSINISIHRELSNVRSNYWLNAIILNDYIEKDTFLKKSNAQGIMTRPIWKLMHHLEPYKRYFHDELTNSLWAEKHIVNIPSGIKDLT